MSGDDLICAPCAPIFHVHQICSQNLGGTAADSLTLARMKSLMGWAVGLPNGPNNTRKWWFRIRFRNRVPDSEVLVSYPVFSGIYRVLAIQYPTRIRILPGIFGYLSSISDSVSYPYPEVPISVPTQKYLYPYPKIRPVLILVSGTRRDTRPVFITTRKETRSALHVLRSHSLSLY
jgi:hypothetical protein